MADAKTLAAVRRLAEHGTPEQKRRARFYLRSNGKKVLK